MQGVGEKRVVLDETVGFVREDPCNFVFHFLLFGGFDVPERLNAVHLDASAMDFNFVRVELSVGDHNLREAKATPVSQQKQTRPKTRHNREHKRRNTDIPRHFPSS
jgi:hypothetical protein